MSRPVLEHPSIVRASLSLVTLASVFVTTSAHAQVSEVAIARQLAIQGIDAVESGDCRKGAPLLERAEQMHHASVHLQYLARCRAAEGRLVIATEMWRQIIREGAPPGASPAILAAISEATTALERTLPRLASTTIQTAGDYPALTLTLDGTPIPAEIVGTPQALDPGAHELVASGRGFTKQSFRWTVAEGGSAEVLVTLTRGQDQPPAPAPSAPSERPEPGSSAFPFATVGWITASAGVVSLVAGTVTWLTRNNRQNTLAANCSLPGQTCPPGSYTEATLADAKQSVHTLTAVTNVLMFGGGALFAGGVTMIVLGGESRGDGHTALLVGGPNATPGLTVRGHW